jgi:hypothetical protein
MQDDLRPRAVFGTLVDQQVPFDDVLVVNPEEGSSGSCIIGMSFKEDHVGRLSQVKWFMNNVTEIVNDYGSGTFAGNVQFQGSNDNSTWTTVFTMAENVHDGWNY